MDSHPKNALDCHQDNVSGKDQLEWLSQALLYTHKNSKKAIIVGHRPPKNSHDDALYKSQCLHQFTNLIKKHSQDILGLYFGHVNVDSIQLLVNQNQSESFQIHTLNQDTLPSLQNSNDSVSGNLYLI